MSADARRGKVVALDFRPGATDSIHSAELTLPQREAAQYIAEMVLQLRNLARSAHLDRGFPELEAAYYEFYGLANRLLPRPEEAEYVRNLQSTASDEPAPVVVPDAFKWPTDAD